MQPVQSQSLETAIATLFTGYLVKKFALDNLYYGFAYTIVLSSWSYLSSFRNSGISLPLVEVGESFRWIFGSVVLLIIFGIYRYYVSKSKPKSEEYVRIYIYDSVKMSKFMKYIRMYPENFQRDCDINIGDKDLAFRTLQGKALDDNLIDITSEIDDVQIPFKDTNFNVSGYICWHKEKRELSDEDRKNPKVNALYLKYLEIALRKGDREVNPRKFADDFIAHLREKDASAIKLDYIKIMKNKSGQCINHNVTIYKGPKRTPEVKENLYMHTFFHQERDRLWSVIKKIDQDPNFFINNGQGARINLLLWGPSGAGKSSYVYRVAMCLDRHIISLDLRNQSKSEIYQVIQRPVIEGSENDSYTKCVLMFEEFDISILELYQQARRRLALEEMWKHYRTNDRESPAMPTTKKKKDEDDNDEDKGEDETDKKLNKSLLAVDSEFGLRDLLEIFQGPIPMNGMILMATTNKYDEIRQLCPELFRPGRLTPVYFGYILREVLQDISKHYFGQKLEFYLPETMTVPTSQIIDLAMESKLQDKPFEYFSQHLQTLLG